MAQWETDLAKLTKRLKEVGRILHIDQQEKTLSSLETEMEQPGFWDDQERAREVSQRASDIRQELEQFAQLKQELRELSEIGQLAQEEGNSEVLSDVEKSTLAIEDQLNDLEFKTLFSGEHDEANAIVSIHAGAGGTDAQDWTEMLTRMLTRFAEQQNWKVEMLDSSPGEEAGYKSITFAVRGRYAYGHVKSEAGVHRLVRISPFDAEGMRHTSFALVEVVPELDALKEKEIEIDENNLRIDTFASGGAGGQSVNTTNSAVRVTHIPTNTVVSIQNERSQQQNKETALRVLKSRLYQRMLEEQKEQLEELKGAHTSPEWGNQIRSYVLHPYKMVKDHRTNQETQDVDKVLDGHLLPFVEAYLKKLAKESP